MSWTREAGDLLGYAADEVLGREAAFLLAPEDADRLPVLAERCVAEAGRGTVPAVIEGAVEPLPKAYRQGIDGRPAVPRHAPGPVSRDGGAPPGRRAGGGAGRVVRLPQVPRGLGGDPCAAARHRVAARTVGSPPGVLPTDPVSGRGRRGPGTSGGQRS
ncbi:hypothetical protein [Streptomyces sp. URMC 129]|uniref:hypothetical protein n=1 Tax=Streptomyces sp. URMC 129 TaxID=3423407 RepID=UPI003F1BC07B